MLTSLVTFAVTRWRIVLVLTILFCVYGWSCFRSLPIEAFPDVTDPMVEVVGLYPGQAAEEVERRVTVELERVLAGTPKLIDLRSVSPLDRDTVLTSLEKTGRMVVVEESPAGAGWGGDLASLAADEGVYFLDAPVKRVNMAMTLTPYSPPLEDAAVPTTARIIAAIRDVMRGYKR
jgi:deoxyxylulose-5-phosphate synthase